MTLFALRHVVTPPMVLPVAEAPRLFLVDQEGDQQLLEPVDGRCVVGGVPAWDTVIEVEEVNLRNRRIKTDDIGWRELMMRFGKTRVHRRNDQQEVKETRSTEE